MPARRSNQKIALALGGGAARGWAHVGVIRALQQRGIEPDLICGTSIGALVGAAYASGEFDRFEAWLRGLNLIDVVGFMDLSLNGGLIKGDKLMSFFQKTFVDRPIEALQIPFAAVATDLHQGAEVWLRQGSTSRAVRASLALPGLLTPVVHDGRTLVDGGLVNPVPVSLARALGADVVIAVDLNADLIGRHLDQPQAVAEAATTKPKNDGASGWVSALQHKLGRSLDPLSSGQSSLPSMFDVIASSINIMQVRITRSRMAGEPPDIVIAPSLAWLGLMDFHRSQDAIEQGQLAVDRIEASLVRAGLLDL